MEAVHSAPAPSSRSPDSRHSSRRIQYFAAKSYAPIWRALRTALVQAEGIILLTGPEGSGKSTLLKRLPGILPDNRDMVVIRSVEIPFPEFLQKLTLATTLSKSVDAGGLSPVDPPPESNTPESDSPFNEQPAMPVMTLQDLTLALEERVAMGRKLVLVVDQAHLLNYDQLRLLETMVRFATEGVKPVQLLLVGRQELRTVLSAEEVKPFAGLVVGRCEMTPLTRGEVWDYLEFQLEHALGWPVRVSWFAWMEFHSYSHGIPLKIDMVLKRLAPLAKQRNAKVIKRSLVRLAMTMGKPLQRGSLFGPVFLDRAPMIAGAAVVLTGLLYLLYGTLFPASVKPATPSGAAAGATRKGGSGENTSYVQVFKGDAPKPPSEAAKVEKPPLPKEARPSEEKTEGKTPAPRKRYWDPNAPPRPEPVLPVPERSDTMVTLPAMERSSDVLESSPQREIPDPESFRKRYQNAKALRSSVVPLPEAESEPTPALPLAPENLPKPSTEVGGAKTIQPPVKVTRPESAPAPAQRPTEMVEKPGVKSSVARETVAAREPPRKEPSRESPREPAVAREAVDKESLHLKHSAMRLAVKDQVAREPVANKPVVAKPPVKEPVAREPAGTRSAAPSAPKGTTPAAQLQSAESLPHVSGVATEKSFRGVGKLYVLQIGSFSNVEKAEQLMKSLAGKGRDPYVHLFERDKRRWFSVRMNYRGRDAAQRMAETLGRQANVSAKVLELNYE
ncbi:MAG: AAA family ATPase [Magnetococcales bacterium]|nr:AAA family ATPase [Magnetococcales bacterium]